MNGLVTTPIVSAPRLLGDLGDDRRRAGAGPAAEPGGDEDHVRVDERLGDLLGVLFGGALADRRVAAGAEAAGDLVADPDLVRRVRLEQRLRVRVAGDELDAHHLGPDHPVDGVAAAAADADDADQREVLGIGTQRHRALLQRPTVGTVRRWLVWTRVAFPVLSGSVGLAGV